MPFSIKYRKVHRRTDLSSATLAVDIDSRAEADGLVDRLAGSYAQNGRCLLPARWFRNGAGLHLIWVQPQ